MNEGPNKPLSQDPSLVDDAKKLEERKLFETEGDSSERTTGMHTKDIEREKNDPKPKSRVGGRAHLAAMKETLNETQRVEAIKARMAQMDPEGLMGNYDLGSDKK